MDNNVLNWFQPQHKVQKNEPLQVSPVKCAHTQLILNKKILSLYSRDDILTFQNGDKSLYSLQDLYFALSFYRASSGVQKISLADKLIKLVCLDRLGVSHQVFLLVPCGQCSLCRKNKISSWTLRFEAECQLYEQLPFMFTLTYKDNYLPKRGVNKEDLQRFIHRLRDQLRYYYSYNEPIRYFMCGEYGSRTHRAHYHCIIWNLPSPRWLASNSKLYMNRVKYYEFIADLCRNAWETQAVGNPQFSYQSFSKEIRLDKELSDKDSSYIGFIYSRQVDNCSGACRYVCKYLNKCSGQSYAVNHGLNPPFVLSSRRFGGIGAPFLRNIKYNGNDFIQFQDIHSYNEQTGSFNLIEVPINHYIKTQLLGEVKNVYGSWYVENIYRIKALNNEVKLYDIDALLNDLDPFGLFSSDINPDTQKYQKFVSRFDTPEKKSRALESIIDECLRDCLDCPSCLAWLENYYQISFDIRDKISLKYGDRIYHFEDLQHLENESLFKENILTPNTIF